MIKMEQHKFEPAESVLVTDMATLRVVSDKLRAQIIDLLRAEPHTVKQLAAALDLRPKQLYYHINLMEKHRLIRVVQTRPVSGIIEKTYRATAHVFLFDKDVFVATNQSDTALNPVLAMMFQATQNQLEQSMQHVINKAEDAPPHQSLLELWNMNRLSIEQATDFYVRLEALLREFELFESTHDEPSHAYRLFVTLFPVRSQATFEPQANESAEE